jgi:hypothetical protein
VADIGIRLEGMDKLLQIVERGGNAPRYLEMALTSEANVVLNQSKQIVPYEFGSLKTSGRVERPQVSANSINVEITYGGPSASYAVYVHEIPKNYNHGKQYKYLETPARAHAPVFTRKVKERLLAFLRQGR